MGGFNIKADNCHIIGTSSINGSGNYVGGIVGKNSWIVDSNFYTELTNISISDKTTISGDNYVGGILGGYDLSNIRYLDSSLALIKSCVSSATIIASGNYTGGILGRISIVPGSFSFGSDAQTFSLDECVNNGQVTGVNYVGGIVGDFAVYAPEEGSEERVLIKQSANEGKVEGTNYVGGIAGRSYASFNNCYSVNEISAEESVAGGIVGINGEKTYTASYINDCYSLATISVGDEGVAGGILGSCISEEGETYISRCYFAGSMPESKKYGIVGHSTGNCHVSSCLTTMPSLVGIWNVNNGYEDVLDEKSEADVVSILAKRDVINGKSAYSEEYWPLETYPAYCIKFSTGLSGSITVPGFSEGEIEI